MTAVLQPDLLTPAEYLEGEELSPIKHEYLGGFVYAMAGASIAHNLIALNLAGLLRSHLRGGACRVLMSDIKVQLSVAQKDIFYYPDLMVACDPRDTHPFFNRFPKIIVEVLSESTEHIDRREKLLSYIQIESLEEYVLLAQNKFEATLFRRANEWRPEIITDPNHPLALPSISFTVTLRDLYEGVVFNS